MYVYIYIYIYIYICTYLLMEMKPTFPDCSRDGQEEASLERWTSAGCAGQNRSLHHGSQPSARVDVHGRRVGPLMKVRMSLNGLDFLADWTLLPVLLCAPFCEAS